MIVYKFGGASVKDASAVRNVCSIIANAPSELIVVVSAMGKTTNALESLVACYMNADTEGVKAAMAKLRDFHYSVAEELFDADELSSCMAGLSALLAALDSKLAVLPSADRDYEYDQIICFGELLSSCILSHALSASGVSNEWVDIRTILRTDSTFRDARIEWHASSVAAKAQFTFATAKAYVTQGFIGADNAGRSTSLGREGSDYTAAILAHLLNADNVTIWKDVPGVMTADPRWYPAATFVPEMTYWEAIELTYSGATVIHPKTLKPLQNKNIPLYVRSFLKPDDAGTVINGNTGSADMPTMLILKTNQVFLSISPKDFSFIVEGNLSEIFSVFDKFRVKMNLMQNSALNFSVCVDAGSNWKSMLDALSVNFNVKYNDGVELLNVRHFDEALLSKLLAGKELIDSQVTRKSARYVLKCSEWRF